MLQMVLRSCMHHLNSLSSPLARWRGQKTSGVQEPKYCGESEWHYWGVKWHYRARNPVLPSSIPPIWQPGSVKYCVTTNWRIITTPSTDNKYYEFWVLTMNRISRWESWITPFRRCQSEFISSINHMNSLHRLILKITCYIWWLKFPILGVSMELEDIIKHHLSGFVSLIMVSLTPHACHITYVHLMCTIHRWNGYTIRKNKIHIH